MKITRHTLGRTFTCSYALQTVFTRRHAESRHYATHYVDVTGHLSETTTRGKGDFPRRSRLRNNVNNNEFGGRFINIGLENDAVAAARVVGGPLDVDVYKTLAKKLFPPLLRLLSLAFK